MIKFIPKRTSTSAASVFLLTAALIAAVGGLAFGQTGDTLDCDDGDKKAEVIAVGSQKAEASAPRVAELIVRRLAWQRVADRSAYSQEKAIKVRPNVYVSVCVRRGAVKVNGWSREEVRAFNRGGKQLGFKVIERGGKDQLPVWVEVLGYEPDASMGEGDKCLTGDMIELDVPQGSSVTIKGLSSETSIESVKSASVNIVGGDIFLRNIEKRIDASTQQGGVTVNNSAGQIAISTTTGNIVAYNTEPVDIGDFFKARTQSGAVTLQSIGQKEVAASTNSGTINYLGEIKNYGKYELTTTNGLINMVIPESSTFWLTAFYGGRFISEFPLTVLTRDETDTTFKLTARFGKGEANIALKSFSGTIRLRKRKEPGKERKEVKLP
jgi:hypothetical protein